MSVIPLTVFFSLLLAGLFMVLFVHEQRRRRFASTERDSLLPLADERGVTVGKSCRTGSPDAAAKAPMPPGQGGTGNSVSQPPSSGDDDLYF